MDVDPTNTEQLRAWDGDEGAYWAEHADHFERALGAYHDRFFAGAAIGPAERVLDVGCGTGHTTRHAARLAADGGALGVDLSSAMLEVARRRAAEEGIGNIEFVQADVQVHPFAPEAFDVAIGQTSAMFLGDRVAGLANVGRALRPGGRLVLLTWQPFERNEWLREFIGALSAGRDRPAPPPGAPGPFALSEPGVIESVLVEAGYAGVTIESVEAPMWFGTDADDAFAVVAGLQAWMLEGLDDDLRARALDDLRTAMAAHETDDGVCFGSSAWLIGAVRR